MHPLIQRADNKPENWRAWIIIDNLLLLYFDLFWAVISVALKQNKEKSHSIKEQKYSSN